MSMKIDSSSLQEDFEKWYAEEEKKMLPFTEYEKQALYLFSRLAWMSACVKLSQTIEKILPMDIL